MPNGIKRFINRTTLFLAGLHIGLHFIGANILNLDPATNFMFFVTPGLVIGYVFYKESYKK